MEDKELEGKNYLVLFYKTTEEIGIKILGYNFVKENQDKYHIIIEGKKRKGGSPYIDIYDYQREKGEAKIILIEDETIRDMSYMFDECDLLKMISPESKWDCKHVYNIQRMFFDCASLNYICPTFAFTSLGQINLSCLFYGCKSLESLYIFEKWNTKDVTDFSNFLHNLVH